MTSVGRVYAGSGGYPPGRGCWGGTPPSVLGLPPPPLAAARGHRAPTGPHAHCAGKRHVLVSHWHTVADWRADVVLISETRLTAVAQRVMRAQAGALGWQAFWGRPWNPKGGGGHLGCTSWGYGYPGTPRHPGQANSSPQGGAPHRGGRPRPNPLALHPLVPRPGRSGPGGGFLHAQVAYGVSAQPALNCTFWGRATQYVA